MASSPVEIYSLGGVDSRSNPVLMPQDRALYCRNWSPNPGGWLELRHGYTEIADLGTGEAIHSQFDFIASGVTYLLVGASTHLYKVNLSTKAVTLLATLSSSERLSFFRSNSWVHWTNGTDFGFYDGTTVRAYIGIRTPTADEVKNVVVSQGIRQPKAADMATLAIGIAGTGGNFATTTGTGFQLYLFYYDPVTEECGPAIAIGSRVTFGSAVTTGKITITGLPNTSTITDAATTGMSKVICRTGDGGASANPCTDGTDWIVLDATTTSVDITNTAIDNTLIANMERGIPASTVGSSGVQNPGFQFYLSFANPVTGDVGTCIKIGDRLVTTDLCNVHITGLPDLSGVNTEWEKQLGRTNDGSEVPYAITDSAGNFAYIDNADTSKTVTEPLVGFDYELPSRNSPVPALDKFAKVGMRCYGAAVSSPYIYYSTSADEAPSAYVGIPAHSWPANNRETFPTGDDVVGINEYGYEPWVFTKSDGAVLYEMVTDTGRQWKWDGPWNLGLAGQRAFCKTPYGPFWLTGDKQLATVGQNGPYIVSEEYETALLSQIGDAYLSEVEVVYFRDALRRKEEIKVKGCDSSGNPFIVVHDFTLRDDRSQSGQGYETWYEGQLEDDFTVAQIRDSSGKLRVYAGGSDGKIYDLDNGANDGGTEFDADYIALVNCGPTRPQIPYIEFRGDGNIEVSIAKTLDSTLDSFVVIKSDANKGYVPGGEHDFQFRANLPSKEVKHVYVRLKLTSHSDDGNLDLSTPPHVPVEDYGRILMSLAQITDPRGH